MHRESLTWKKNPIQNVLWISLITIMLVLVLGLQLQSNFPNKMIDFRLIVQVIYTILNLYHIHNSQNNYNVSIWGLAWYIIVLIFLSPPLTFLIAEIVKWQEIQ